MKRIISILFILLVLCGCTTPKVTDGEVIIDLTQEFDVNTILENVKEDTEVSYELDKENSKIIISLTRNDETETLEKEVTILEPQYTIKDDIKFNPYLDYNINDFITVDEGVKINHTVDTKTSKITFNLSKGIWSKTVEKEFTIDSLFDFSNVGEYGALIYKSIEWTNREDIFNQPYFNGLPNVGSYDVIVFSPQYTGFYIRYIGEMVYPKTTTFTWDENGNINFDYGIVNEIYNSNGKVEYYKNFFGGNDMYHETFTIQEDGIIKTIVNEERAEYIYFEKEQNFKQPFDSLQKIKDTFGRSPSHFWTSMPELENVWYEPKYINYSDDYNGIKKYASTIWPR